MDDGEMALVPDWLECGHRRMEAEHAIEIDNRVAGDVDGRAHGIVRAFAMWHDDVESVRGSALEDHHEALVAGTGAEVESVSCAREKAGERGGADRCHGSALHECSPCDCHTYLL